MTNASSTSAPKSRDFQPLSLGILFLLDKTCSAVLSAKQPAPFEIPQLVAAIFILTRPISETLTAYEKGPLAFEAAAAMAASSIPITDLPALSADLQAYANAQHRLVAKLAPNPARN